MCRVAYLVMLHLYLQDLCFVSCFVVRVFYRCSFSMDNCFNFFSLVNWEQDDLYVCRFVCTVRILRISVTETWMCVMQRNEYEKAGKLGRSLRCNALPLAGLFQCSLTLHYLYNVHPWCLFCAKSMYIFRMPKLSEPVLRTVTFVHSNTPSFTSTKFIFCCGTKCEMDFLKNCYHRKLLSIVWKY